ncbi:MAG: endonuclease/exonuclease/phosphatase family protein [Patescibacteria group bacterium]|jgi:endonuclease/exonuclease/phosphatase family metal-dependent hydrolase
MRVASYNILSGGFNSYSYDSPLPERIDILKKVIKSINADFIGLIDTFRWDSLYTNKQLAELFSYKSAYCINLNDQRLIKKGHNNGITVLTNVPVDHFETVRIETRNAIKSTLKINKNTLDIFTVYLDDLSEDTRILQSKKLLQNVSQDNPTIVMGDLNTLSEHDIPKIIPFIDQLATESPQIYEGLHSVLSEMKRGEVIKMFEAYGLKDAGKNEGPTAPTRLVPMKIENPILRIDYAFHTDNIQVLNFKILKDTIFDQASDHYPIVFELEYLDSSNSF